MKKILCVFAILAAFAVNTALGATIAGAVGFNPLLGAAVSNAAGIVSAFAGGFANRSARACSPRFGRAR